MQQYGRSGAYGVLLAALTATVSPLAAQEDLALDVFRTQTRGGVTAVDAVAEISPQVLLGEDGCSYAVQITIMDVNRSVVATDDWIRSVECGTLSDTTQRVIDTFSFGIRNGRHLVEMMVVPASGRQYTARQAVDPLRDRTPVSDLFLAREVAWDTTAANPWPVRKGGIGIAAEAVLDITTARPFVAYYLELYADTNRTGSGVITGSIRRRGGETRVTEFTLQRIDSLATSRTIAGTVSLAGLPPGAYEFDVDVVIGDGTPVRRTRGFRVVERAEPAPARSVRVNSALQTYFANLSDEELERFDAVTIWMTEQNDYLDLSPTAARTYLAEFFSRVVPPGPEPVEPGEAALRVYLQRMNEVERNFETARGDATAAWETPRGRLWMKYGAPDDRIQRPFPGNNTRPYEIWYYSIGAGYVYLFVDETGFRNYRILYSSDPTQPSLPGWQSRAGIDAVRELTQYYGIRETN